MRNTWETLKDGILARLTRTIPDPPPPVLKEQKSFAGLTVRKFLAPHGTKALFQVVECTNRFAAMEPIPPGPEPSFVLVGKEWRNYYYAAGALARKQLKEAKK